MLHRAVEGLVADNRMSSFPPACCCWQGTCREGLRRRGGRRRGRGPGGASSRPWGAAQRSCAGSGPLPRAGAHLPVDCVLLLGGVAGAAVRGCDACRAVGGGLQSGASLFFWSLPPRSSSLTVTGCRLGGFPVRRDRWGGERVVGGSVCSSMSSSCLRGQVRFGGGPSHFFIPLVLGPLNSLVWYVPSLRDTRGLG